MHVNINVFDISECMKLILSTLKQFGIVSDLSTAEIQFTWKWQDRTFILYVCKMNIYLL